MNPFELPSCSYLFSERFSSLPGWCVLKIQPKEPVLQVAFWGPYITKCISNKSLLVIHNSGSVYYPLNQLQISSVPLYTYF